MGNHRVADPTALAGLAVAIAALLAVGSLLVVKPILLSVQGPDPCGYEFLGQNGGPDKQSFMSCVSAHVTTTNTTQSRAPFPPTGRGVRKLWNLSALPRRPCSRW